jgi:hypothetical protein
MPIVVPCRVLQLAAVLALVAGAGGCGGNGRAATSRTTTTAADTGAQRPADNTPADPAVRYFHDQLVVNGEEIQSDFGGSLLALGLNPRDLQQDTPEHAYQTVLQKVREVPDGTQRRDMMRVFFGTDNVQR